MWGQPFHAGCNPLWAGALTSGGDWLWLGELAELELTQDGGTGFHSAEDQE